jgi:GNAT superfamily N-acetyltransferase
MVLDRVWVRPDYRGNGLGPIIAAAVIQRLGRGCHLAACYPAPFEETDDPADRDRAVAALGRLWATVGFRQWGDGVWMLAPQEHDTHAALAELVAARAVFAT